MKVEIASSFCLVKLNQDATSTSRRNESGAPSGVLVEFVSDPQTEGF